MAKNKEQEAEYKAEGLRRAALRKQKRKNTRKSGYVCESCGNISQTYIDKVINPYYQDINGIEVWERLCDDCYTSCMGDI